MVELREYQPIQCQLTKNEIEQLLGTQLVSLSPLAGEDMYQVKAGSQVGTIMLPSLRLLIRPKVSLENVFFLLGFGAGMTHWSDEQFPYEQEPDLLRAVAWVFEAEVRRASGQGLVRGYQPRHETLPTVRGRIDVAAQLRARQGLPFPLECRFEEFTEDIELNRVVKAAHRRLLQTPGLNAELARRLRFRYRAFDEVTLVEYTPLSVPEVSFTRLNRHWEVAVGLAQLILRQQTLRDRAGTVIGVTFTVDMNKLFERFVETVIGEEVQRAGWQLAPQAGRHLTPQIHMRPDLVLQNRGQDYAVADTKYKELDIKEWPHADLYQLLAYCVALGLPAGLLIYAGLRPFERHTVEHAGINLEVVGVDLSVSPDEILYQVRDIAKRLIAQAAETRQYMQRRAA
jgi:5-methylcytosine-specific restriction enzyme subunit McrC